MYVIHIATLFLIKIKTRGKVKLLLMMVCFSCLQNHVNNIIRSEVAREGDVIYSNFPTHSKLDLELIRREKMQKKVSLADQIQAAKVIKGKLH